MALHTHPDQPRALGRLLLVGGGLFLALRLMRGLVSLLWSAFAVAMAFYATGALGVFG